MKEDSIWEVMRDLCLVQVDMTNGQVQRRLSFQSLELTDEDVG